jgi:hypothetical protein
MTRNVPGSCHCLSSVATGVSEQIIVVTNTTSEVESTILWKCTSCPLQWSHCNKQVSPLCLWMRCRSDEVTYGGVAAPMRSLCRFAYGCVAVTRLLTLCLVLRDELTSILKVPKSEFGDLQTLCVLLSFSWLLFAWIPNCNSRELCF